MSEWRNGRRARLRGVWSNLYGFKSHLRHFFCACFQKKERLRMQKQYGFTLAETLLTLVIIGTVFLYTVPAVISDYKNRDIGAAYQKAINNLNNAYAAYFSSPPTDNVADNTKKYARTNYGSNGEILDENGNPETDSNPVIKYDWVDDGNRYNMGDAKLDNLYKILNRIITKHMQVVNIKGVSDTKIVYYTIETDNKSFYNYTTLAACSAETTPIEYFYTADGMRYCISYNKIANNSNFGEDSFGVIWVDINGEKGPNEIYRNINTESKPIYAGDTLPITILKDRFVPGHPTKDTYNNNAQALFFNKK